MYDDDWWPREIEEMQDDAVTINFMEPQSGVNRYTWPQKTERPAAYHINYVRHG